MTVPDLTFAQKGLVTIPYSGFFPGGVYISCNHNMVIVPLYKSLIE